MKKSILLSLLLMSSCIIFSQDNPYSKYGFEPKIATMTNGKYIEVHDQDTIVQIGRVVFNTMSMTIVGFIELDTMYSEATLAPDIVSRWLSPDPLAHWAPGWSPYRFGFDNPIMYTDPTGLWEDNFQVGENGDITLLEKTDDDFDVLFNADKSSSLQVDKGILGNSRKNTVTASNNKEYTFKQYDVKGDQKASELFEFVSDNSNVEWSLTGIGNKSGSLGKSILTTSNKEASEIGGGYLFAKNYTIRQHSHSHPYGSVPSTADKSFASSVSDKFKDATFQIYHKQEYFQYDKQGSLNIPVLSLPTIEITVPK